MSDQLKKAQAQVKELKEEVSELGRQHEIRGRELTHARKQAAKADDLAAALDMAEAEAVAQKKRADAAEKEAADLAEKLAKTNGILDDVAALKRLVA